jgi:hypothetical protein
VPDDLNTSRGERLKAIVALVLLLGLAATLALPGLWPIPVIATAAAVGLNWDFVRYLFNHAGLRVALGGLVYHQFYYVYSSATFAWCLFEHLVLHRRGQRVIS